VIRLVFPAAHRRGGIERVVWEHARWFGRRTDVEFVGYRFDEADRVENLTIVQPPGGPGHRSPRLLRRDMTAAVRSLPPAPAISFGAVCPPAQVVNVGSVHRRWVLMGDAVPVGPLRVPGSVRRVLPRHRALLALERAYFLHPTVETFVAISDNVAGDLMELYGIDAGRIHIIPNGYAEDEFNAARRAELRGPTRARIVSSPEEIAVLFVANELHRKGFATLVDAVARLSDPRVHIHVVGAVSTTAYAGRVQQLGLTDRVHYHGPSDDVAAYMAAADLFVLPTRYEAFGLVIVEALAMGTPVITSRAAGASPAVHSGVNGYLLDDPSDAEELHAALTEALGDHRLAALQAGTVDSALDYRWSSVLPRIDALVRSTDS
jgi:UDP-glucose:(heptosyl)LPS alpha-1,3-glucosyltransferase